MVRIHGGREIDVIAIRVLSKSECGGGGEGVGMAARKVYRGGSIVSGKRSGKWRGWGAGSEG